jgi:hypothetical protein
MSVIKEGKFIKCPACGSTSQVEMVWGSASDGRYSRLERDYACGCGCEFTVFFEATSFSINKNEER